MSPVEMEVCQAASDLFLDTETRWSIPYIAFKARESRLPWSQIDGLFRQRLVPVLLPNLYDIAGEWAGFDSSWLASALESPPRQSRSIPEGLLRHWQCVQDFVEWNELPRHWRTFQALARVLFESQWHLNSPLQHLVEQPWSELDSLCQQVFRPRFEPLRLDCDSTPQQFEANWQWLRTFHRWRCRQPASTWEVCSQLEAIFTLQDLATAPRGAMVVEFLREHDREWIRHCLEGPLSKLHPEQPSRAANLAYILSRIG